MCICTQGIHKSPQEKSDDTFIKNTRLIRFRSYGIRCYPVEKITLQNLVGAIPRCKVAHAPFL